MWTHCLSLWRACFKKLYSTQSCSCFKCKGKHHVSICDKKSRTHDHSSKSIQKQSPSTAKIETQTNLNDTPCNVLFQTAVANVYLSNKSESRPFCLLFDSGAQLSYVSPKVKVFLNPEIKAKKEVVLKKFDKNSSNKKLGVVELLLNQSSQMGMLNCKSLLQTSATFWKIKT